MKMIINSRCKALIKHQRNLDIFKSNKHSGYSTFHYTSTAVENVTISETPNSPWVRINSSSINKNFDLFQCNCGLHSLLYLSGRFCDQAEPITNRAKFLVFSTYRR